MNTARYWIALFILSFVPGGFLFWFSIHPFIRFWRKFGPRSTLAIHYCGILTLAAMTIVFRKPLLSIEFGTNWWLVGLGLCLIVVSASLRRRLSGLLRYRILTGMPELDPSRDDNKLLVEGIYSRIRHPRYAQILVGLLGYAMITNYLALYLLFLGMVVAILLIVQMEERELRERFGASYEQYCARVPRFIPRF